MKTHPVQAVLAASALTVAMGFSTQALALVITPEDAIAYDIFPPLNCEPDCVYDALGLTNEAGTADDLILYYKADVGKSTAPATVESGTFATSYETTFSLTEFDPQNALIEYISGASIACPECYLAIKDGNADPAYYFYNLSAWNGTDDISIEGFWPGGGAISHVSIWGREGGGDQTEIPEPGVLLLMGAGLLGLGMARRRKAA